MRRHAEERRAVFSMTGEKAGNMAGVAGKAKKAGGLSEGWP
jgi:hypothetical protein